MNAMKLALVSAVGRFRVRPNGRPRPVRVFSAAACLVLTVGASGACGSDSPAASDEAYNIGWSGYVSGPLAPYGANWQKTLRAYFDSVNAKGGINGHKVNIHSLDEFSPAGSGQATINGKELINENKVSAIFGGLAGVNCSAYMPLAVQYKVPILCGTPPASLEPSQVPYMFGVGENFVNSAEPMVSFASANAKDDSPTVAIFYTDTPAAVAFADLAEVKVQEKGWDLVYNEKAPIDAVDVAPYAAQIAAKNPDFIFAGLLATHEVTFYEQLVQNGFTGTMINSAVNSNYGPVSEISSPNFVNLGSTIPVTPESPGENAKQFIDDMGGVGLKTAAELNGLNSNVAYWLAAKAVGDALEDCGFPCPGEKLQEFLVEANITMPDLTSGFSWSADYHVTPSTEYNAYYWDSATDKPVVVGTYPSGRVGY